MKAAISPIFTGLARRRGDAGLTQQAVANLAGLTQSYLSAVERGRIDVRLSTLHEIARALRSDLVLVPLEILPSVRALIGEGLPLGERRLFQAEPD